jgi:polysaccharide deacetylase family protein (PEP-CTERM system associated)
MPDTQTVALAPRTGGAVSPASPRQAAVGPPIVLSFDVEEHDRIEAAVGLSVSAGRRREYADRMAAATHRLLDQLAAAGNVSATFYVVGQIAETHPRLVRAIADAGHEIGSHSHSHTRVHRLTPRAFREDLRRSVDALQQVTGRPVFGFRAPTFSVTRATDWAVDALIESGLRYDSSVFPVRHDRYGVSDAPRHPFWLEGEAGRILELPLLTLRLMGRNVPVAGGGYFRLFPPALMRAGLRQLPADAAVGMLYFHPWEFDPDQPRLPLARVSRWRTYVGVGKTTDRLNELLTRYRGRFRRAIDVAEELEDQADRLPRFRLAVDPAAVINSVYSPSAA